jgi:PAS domain S-box-containing protein
MWKLLFSLRYRIILSIVVIEVVMLSIMVWANTTEVRETHSERLAQSVDVIMQQFTTTVGRYLIEADYASLEEYANAVMQHDELDYIVVLDVWDEVLLKVGKAPDLQGLRPIPSVSREGVLDVSGGIVFGGKPRGAVRMGFSLAQVERTVQEALNRGVAIAATEIVLSIIAAFLLGHVLTRNLKTLSLAAEHFGRGEAGVVLSARGRDEVAQVAGAFNRMVGERKRAEEALRKSEEQVRLLLECAGEGIYGLDLEGRCTFANAECLRLLGYDDVGALLGENMHELIHHTRPDGSPYPQSECLILQAFRKGAGTHCDGEVLWRADGTCFPAEYRSFPVVREGETIGAVINFSDITERKQAAEALGESEQLFSRAFHASPALFAIASPEDGKLYDVNETWLATLGYDREEVLKHSVLELGIWVDPKERARFVERLRTERSVPEFEARFRTKAGEELLFLTAGEYVEIGGEARLLVVSHDITERKRAEAALRESEALFKSVVDNTSAAIFIKDTEGRFILVNKPFETWNGLEAGQAIGKTAYDFFSSEQADVFVAQDRQVIETGKPVVMETEVHFEDGQTRHCLITRFPVMKPGEGPFGVGAVVTDLTELKAAERQLLHAQKLETIGQLTGGMAHDFNNLLAVVMGNLQLVGEELRANPELHERIDDALEAARSGGDLTHRLLAFSRRQALVPVVADPNALVSGMSRILERTLGETIEIETVLAKDLWYSVVDRVQLETALLNLAVNARDAMPEGGRLTIETANARLDRDCPDFDGEATPGDYVMFAVSDTGTGMPSEVAQRAFEPFFTTKEVGRGSGLGLSMVYGFVRQSGGYVKLYSEAGRGTTVKIYLPKAAETAMLAEPQVETSGEPHGAGERILVVEDQPEVRSLAVRLLGRLGYEVAEAASGSAALAILREDPGFDLLFTDIVLPSGMDGTVLATRARDLCPSLGILYTTGYTGNAVVRGGTLNPDAAVLSKPFDKRELARQVRQVLDRGAASSRPAPAKRARAAAAADPGVGVVLVVDDDLAVRDSTAGLLELRGYRVLQAGDGAEALALLEHSPEVGVMLTDIRLADGMDGLVLGRRALCRRPGLKVLYVSGDTGAALGEEGVAPGHYIAKPFTLEELDRRIREAAVERPGH